MKKAIWVYVIILVLMFLPVILIPFMGESYMQVGWAYLYFTLPIGALVLLMYTIYLVAKKKR